MSFQPRARAPRDFGRRPAKSRPKARTERHQADESQAFEEQHARTREEVVERTLNSLTHLGNQRFAVAPFYDHYDRWIMSLRTILAEFESSEAVTVDQQFAEESSRVLSEVELALREKRLKEISREEQSRSLSQKTLEARSLLMQAEREYEARMKELASQRERSVKPVAIDIGRLRQELARVVRMRAGFLRGISKKAKAQKEAEASQKLESTRKELAKVERSFAAEQAKLRKDRQKQKQQLLEKIATYQKELENLEADVHIDDAVDVRRTTCESLANSVNTFLNRIGKTSETTNPT